MESCSPCSNPEVKMLYDRSSNDFLIYEAGRCLSHAIVREWLSVFAPSGNEVENQKASELLIFILKWAEQRGLEVAAASRQSVLRASAAIVKRSAAAFASQVASQAWNTSTAETGSTRRRARQRLPSALSEDAGPPCGPLLQLVEHIDSMIRSAVTQNGSQAMLSSKQTSGIQCCRLGLGLLTALLDEMSNSEDSAILDLPFEAHVFMHARFQDHELLRLFQTLLFLTDHVVNSWAATPLSALSAEQSEVMFRLVSALNSIISWNFLPRAVVSFLNLRVRPSIQENTLRPGLTWTCVFGPATLPNTMNLMIKLHHLVRHSDDLGTRTLSSLARLAALTGPLTNPPSGACETNSLSSVDHSRLHVLICMDHLSFWLADDPSPGDGGGELHNPERLINAFTESEQEALRRECSQQIANPTAIPRLPLRELATYELPILSYMVRDIKFRISSAWDPVLRLLALSSKMDGSEPVVCFQQSVVSILVLDRFFARMCTLMIQCLHFLAKFNATDPDGDGQTTHEAVERLFSSWMDFVLSIPSTGATKYNTQDNTLAMPLVTGQSDVQEQRAHQIRQLVLQLDANVTRHQSRLFQTYLLSKLGPECGLRLSGVADVEEIQTEMTEDDLTASEDSLYGCGHCGLSDPREATQLLLQLINERINRLVHRHASSGETGIVVDQSLIDLYEDLHWLLLVTGHFLIVGPSHTTSWDLSIPPKLVNADEQLDLEISAQLLRIGSGSAGAGPMTMVDWPPSAAAIDTKVPCLIRLFSSLHRFLWLQANLGLGSAQLLEDTLWLMTRYAVTYLVQAAKDDQTAAASKTDSSIDSSSIMRVLRGDRSSMQPAIAHQDNPQGSLSNGAGGLDQLNSVLVTCVHSLLHCGHMILGKWSSEPQVLAAAIRLIKVLGLFLPQPVRYLACPAWYEICALLIESTRSNSITQQATSSPPPTALSWPDLTPDSLLELTEACFVGSWAIDRNQMSGEQAAQQSTESLSMQLQTSRSHSFKSGLDTISLQSRLAQVLQQFRASVSRNPVNSTIGMSISCHGGELNTPMLDAIIHCLAALRGVTRAAGVYVAHAALSTDLISLLWTGLLHPMLESGVNLLIPHFFHSSELVQAIVSVFDDVANTCLYYLADVPHSAASIGSAGPQDRRTATAAATFLALSVKLCENYARQHQNNVNNLKPSSEDDRTAELLLLLRLLHLISAHDFDLHLPQLYSISTPDGVLLNPSASQTTQPQGESAVVISVGHLLPLFTDNLLMIPELRQSFYSLISYAFDLHVESLHNLSTERLTCLGRLLRLGVLDAGGSGGIGTSSDALRTPYDDPSTLSVQQQCLEIYTILCDHVLEVRGQDANRNPTSVGDVSPVQRLCSAIQLDTQLLIDLFGLITRDSYLTNSTDTAFASALLSLIHLDLSAYEQLIQQWLNSCSDAQIQTRLSHAFECLGVTPPTADGVFSPAPVGTSCYTAAFNNRKPTRSARVEFQQRFRQFVAEVRAFACRA